MQAGDTTTDLSPYFVAPMMRTSFRSTCSLFEGPPTKTKRGEEVPRAYLLRRDAKECRLGFTDRWGLGGALQFGADSHQLQNKVIASIHERHCSTTRSTHQSQTTTSIFYVRNNGKKKFHVSFVVVGASCGGRDLPSILFLGCFLRPHTHVRMMPLNFFVSRESRASCLSIYMPVLRLLSDEGRHDALPATGFICHPARGHTLEDPTSRPNSGEMPRTLER